MHETSKYTEPELLRMVAEGNGAAFQQLFSMYWPQVYGTSLHLTRSPEQAKDLSQEIFIRLWTNRLKLADVKKLDAFIYTLSRNLILDHLRKKVFNVSNIDFLVDYFQDDTVTAQEKLEYQELGNVINNAIDILPGKVQEVFRLSRFEGLTHEQIAQKLNISVVTSKTYVVRALQEIRRILSDQPDKIVLLAVILLSGFPD